MGVTIVTISCDNCKKEFNKTKKDIKNKHVFCSKECENEYRHKQTHEIRKCEFCGEEFECSKKSTKKFCSRECVAKWQSTQLGSDNPRFKQEEISCEWCNKKYYAKQSKINNGQHNFCGTECRQEWFANEYSQRESTKIASQKRAINMLESGMFDKVNTECQNVVNNLLNTLQIRNINEKSFNEIYAIDNYLTGYNLIIEVMGTYWHTDPRKYQNINYDMQVDRIRRDKAKHSFFINNENIEILYLWEEDIMNNSLLCEKLIKEYIDNKGRLENYNSFNYMITNNKLELIGDIIIPYSEYEASELNKIIDLSVKEQMSRKQEDKWIKYNCETCGKECEELISHYNKKKHHYCSKECMDSIKQIKVNCKCCGKEFTIQKSVYNKSKTKQFACSLQCKYNKEKYKIFKK